MTPPFADAATEQQQLAAIYSSSSSSSSRSIPRVIEMPSVVASDYKQRQQLLPLLLASQ